MCIVFYTQSQPGFKLVLAANRDEFLDRPATDARWHNFDSPSSAHWVLCGQDLGSPDKGTWLGLTKDLRLGFLTNIRYPLREEPPDPPSRGQLLKSFLAPPPDEAPNVADYLATIEPERYVGFNLLLFNFKRQNGTWGPSQSGYMTNRPDPASFHPDTCGCQGVSNSPWQEPYPKVRQGQQRMAATLDEWARCDEDDDDLIERLMDLLSPSPPVQSADDMTCAIQISPMLVGGGGQGPAALHDDNRARWYATRVATVVLVKDDGHVVFVERDRAKLEGGQVVQRNSERRQVFKV